MVGFRGVVPLRRDQRAQQPQLKVEFSLVTLLGMGKRLDEVQRLAEMGKRFGVGRTPACLYCRRLSVCNCDIGFAGLRVVMRNNLRGDLRGVG